MEDRAANLGLETGNVIASTDVVCDPPADVRGVVI
jgi:hypothetical protein